MKNTILWALLLMLVAQACYVESDEPLPASDNEYVPVLMDKSILAESVATEVARPLENPGKIYLYHDYILIVEKYKGVHIIDNQNPLEPQNIGFISIPGNMDVAVKNFTLFADNATDLVAIDISRYPDIEVTKRIPNALPEPTPPNATFVPWEFTANNRPDNTVIVAWEKVDNKEN